MSNYPRDEFDEIPENSSRHGVHRSSLETKSNSLVPLMTFGVVALCIGLLAFLVLPKLGFNDASADTAATETATTQVTTKATAPATTAPATTAPVETPKPTPTPTPTPDSVVDKATPVAIFNAAGTVGLAAKYTGIAQSDGWTVSQAANWGGAPQSSSVIFYDGVVQKANAEELGKLMGIARLVDTSELQIPIAVVLGPGTN